MMRIKDSNVIVQCGHLQQQASVASASNLESFMGHTLYHT